MEGKRGYYTTWALFAIAIALFVSIGSVYILGALLVLTGLIGGFVAPYHLRKNAVKNLITIIIIAAIFLLIVSKGDVGIFIILPMIVVVFMIVISPMAWFGSLVGGQVYDRSQFTDLPEFAMVEDNDLYPKLS